MKRSTRSPLVARCCVILALILFGHALVAAPNEEDISEHDVPKEGTILIMFPHFYPERTAPGTVGKLRIESQINGVRRSKQVILSLIRADGREEYYFPFGINVLSPRYIKASVSNAKGSIEERLRNVFYDSSHRTVALAADYEFLPKILPRGNSTIFYLFAGPFPKGMSKTQRARALKNYQRTNYILFRLL